MQVLVLCNQESREFIDGHALAALRETAPSGIIVDTIENVVIKKGKIFSNGNFNSTSFPKEIELYPSFLVLANSDSISSRLKFDLIKKSIIKWHPYCQQMLFSTKNVRSCLDDYLARNCSEKRRSNCEAFVHIASLKQRAIHVHGVNILADSLCKQETDIAQQLKYEFDKLFNSLVSYIKFEPEEDFDKSIFLKVQFFVDDSVDVDIHLGHIEIIEVDNFSLLEGRGVGFLKKICKQLMGVKRKQNASIGSNNKNYVRVCEDLDVDCEPITRNMYFLKKGGRKAVYIPYHRTVQSKVAIDGAGSKVFTNELLRTKGFKVSKHLTVLMTDIDDSTIERTFENLNPPYVIKPIDQSAGYGVFLNINTREVFYDAIEKLRKLEKVNQIIIEEQFAGNLYRFMVIGDQVVAVLKASYPVLCGDGKSSIRTLIKQYNTVNRRRIKLDDSTMLYLSSLGVSPETILENGKTMTAALKKNGDVLQNVTTFVSEKFKKIAVDVNSAFGLKVNGVDMMISADGDYRIIELNPVPALYPHLAPNYGESLDIFKQVIEYVLTNASNEFYDCSDIYEYHY